ncbi:DUF2878 domain-containing protein [Aliidiomarina minuta]|uniref:DUF2878 domain-containing protein n=1 Tax=Aliidiomarina minuta TaxID=880057 RepID=UPI0013008E77|nr:DUF2878 domain-containing protein [Aliidiomarina minuta]
MSAVWGREDWLWATSLMVVVLYASAYKYLWQQRKALLVIITVGLIAEYLVVALGLITFTGTDYLPVWLVLLWVGFSAMALVVFGWLGQRYWLAAVAGIIFGPITYFAGVRLGAAEMLTNPWLVGTAYSFIWALLMMLILYFINSANKESFK